MPAGIRSADAHIEAPSELSPEMAHRLHNELQRLVDRDDIKHAVIAIESVDRTFRWAGAAGHADMDGTPMRPDTRFWMASVTKLCIAASIFKLYERGLIQLDASIGTYLPADLIGGIHVLGGVDYTDQITIKHLLGHFSGLPDYLEDRPRDAESMLERLTREDFSWTIDDVATIVRNSLTPHFPPGSLDEHRQRIRYSDTNYQLLIAIIQEVTAKSIHEAFSELLYQPLGLKLTAQPGVDPDADAVTATVWNETRPLHIPLAMRSAGDLSSTADEMLQFMRGLVTAKIFDNPDTRDAMQSHWNRFGFSLNPAPTSPTWPIEYGLGMMRFRLPRIFTPLHPLPGVIGHTGVSGSWLFYAPQMDTMFAGTVDQLTASAVPFRLVPRLLRILDMAGA